MKTLLMILVVTSFSQMVSAKVEVVCASTVITQKGSGPGSDAINDRIKVLEAQGHDVNITQLSVASGGAGAGAGAPSQIQIGYVVIDKECAVLKY